MQDNSSNKNYRELLSDRQGRGFSEYEVVEILRQILPSLDKMHSKGKAHGAISLKSLVQIDELAKLIDGIPDLSSCPKDIFELGLVVITLLTAKPPRLLKNVDGSWNWDDYYVVSDELTEIINRMLAVNPPTRFNSAVEVLSAMGLAAPQPIVNTLPVGQPIATSTQLPAKSFPTWIWAAIGAGSTLLVALVGVGVWNLIPPKPSSVVATSPTSTSNTATTVGTSSNNSSSVATIEIEDEMPLFPIRQNNKFGYIDRTGKIVINPQFDRVYNIGFYEGLAPVGVAEKSYYIDKTGKIVVAPQVEFSRRSIEITGKTHGGNSGNSYFAPQVEVSRHFHDGLAVVRINRNHGYIDKTGKIVITPLFDGSGDFHDGLAKVEIGNKCGFIDKTGKAVIDLQFDTCRSFSEGLAAVEIGNKWGFVDKTGKLVVNTQFDNVASSRGTEADEKTEDVVFSEGLAAIEIGSKWGFIDKTGKLVINPQFDSAYRFSDGLAAVTVDGMFGFIDKTGRVVINSQFSHASSFSDGLATIVSDGYGFIDRTGRVVIAPQFKSAMRFRDGLAWVRTNSGTGFIDKTGRYVWTSPSRTQGE